MLFNSFTASAFLLALTSSVNAQASTAGSPNSGSVFTPALGNASPGVNDVLHPNDTAPCGGLAIGSNLDSSTPITVGSNLQFSPRVTSFGAGTDNSRLVQTAKVDPSGKGESFVDCKIIKNGAADPSAADTEQLTLQLPDNTECAGGNNKNRCLVVITTDKGDGNCLVLTQGKTTPTTSTPKPTATNGGKSQTKDQKGDQQKQTNTQNGGLFGGLFGGLTNNFGHGSTHPRMLRKSRA